MPDVVGVDIGGTKMLGVLASGDDPTRIRHEERRDTPAGTEAVVAELLDLVDTLDPSGAAAVGVGIPGLVDHGDVFRYGPNLPDVIDLDVGRAVSGPTGRVVVVDNDATCATAAEFHAGAGAGHDDGLLLTLGTGIGGGLVVDGRLRHGAHGFAGEAGHMLIDPSGPVCPCGRRGCWERFASGSGLGRLGRDAALAGRLGAAVELAGDAEGVRGEHVVEAARAGDPDAASVLDEYAAWLAAGIANLVNVLDPSIVVLGGGVIEAADVLMDRVNAALEGRVMAAEHRPKVPVVAASFGERAGAVGAAVLAARAAGHLDPDRTDANRSPG